MEIVEEGFLLIHNVPYVTPEKVVKRGTLVSNLYHSGGETIKPQWHAAFFIGEYPSSAAGVKLNFVVAENKTPVGGNYVADFTLSAKADYADHY
ncbi:MAG: ThiF family adenylyltransferase, partial [Bacteroidota bacterium]|nr:ThiF family adenylyltransferase [Bacteroidota bacterium]